MANILDYLTWRGDLPFSASPFNEVDNLILSELAFVDFAGILPEDFSGTMTLREAARLLSEYRAEDMVELGVLLPKDLVPLLQRSAESERFGSIALCGYENRIDEGSQLQFAAVTMLLGDGTVFVSYRGTDDTLVGWKEDFNMSFLSVVPAQTYAARYLDRVASLYPHKLRIGGHSKGGNLAVYAAAKASLDTQKRILCVYNNDGPGFLREFLDSTGYARIRDRVRTIVPETSIVGMLLEHECAYTIVKSTNSGIFQHDGFSWEVLGTGFIVLDDRTSESKLVDRTLKAWVASIVPEERERFVEALYQVLSSTSAATLSDIHADKDALWRILKSITPEQRSVLQKTLRGLIYEGQRVIRADRDEQRMRKKALAEEKRTQDRIQAETEKRKKSEELAARRAEKKREKRPIIAVRSIRFRVVKVQATTKRDSKHGLKKGAE